MSFYIKEMKYRKHVHNYPSSPARVNERKGTILKKKFLALLLVMSIVAITFGGCSQKTTNVNSSTDSTQKTTVKMLVAVTGGKTADEMKLFEQTLSKAVNLDVTMEKPTDYDDVLMAKLKSGEKYDLVYCSESQLVESLVPMGVVKDITKEVEASKTLWDTANIPRSEWNAIMINGKIYAGFNKKEIERVVNVNSVLAGKAGMDAKNIDPSLDGYQKLFQAEKTYNDTTAKVSGFYPFNTDITDMYDLQPWFSSVGLKGGVVTVKGKRTVPWSTDTAAPVWQWLAGLYKQGLLDPSCLTDNTSKLRNKFQTGQTGTVVDWAAWTGLYNSNAGANYPNSFTAYPLPGTKDSSGNYMLCRGDASLFAVPTNAQNEAGAIKVLEYFATQEGGTLLSLGIKDNDYTVDSSGKYQLTATGKTHGMDHGAPFPISSKFVNPIGNNPNVDTALSYMKYATTEEDTLYTTQYKQTVAKYGAMIISGQVDVNTGLEYMRNQLQALHVIG